MVALSGSRHHQATAIYPVVKNLMLSSGVHWAVGCCPSGLDQVARSIASSFHLPITVFHAQNRSSAALRLRTIQLIHASTCVISFPISSCIALSGSWLAVAQAACSGKPVFVWLPSATSPEQLPTWRNIVSWQRVPCTALPFFCQGLAFWQPIIQSVQISLFQEQSTNA